MDSEDIIKFVASVIIVFVESIVMIAIFSTITNACTGTYCGSLNLIWILLPVIDGITIYGLFVALFKG